MTAGIDMEMVSTNYVTYGAQLLAAGRITMHEIEDAVRRILRIKFRLVCSTTRTPTRTTP